MVPQQSDSAMRSSPPETKSSASLGEGPGTTPPPHSAASAASSGGTIAERDDAGGEDMTCDASAPPDPPSRSLSGSSDRAPIPAAASSEPPPHPVVGATATTAGSSITADVDLKLPMDTNSHAELLPRGINVTRRRDDANPPPHFVPLHPKKDADEHPSRPNLHPQLTTEEDGHQQSRPHPPIATHAHSDSLVHLPPLESPTLIKKKEEEMEVSTSSAAEEDWAAAKTHSGTPPPMGTPLGEEADNDESVSTAAEELSVMPPQEQQSEQPLHQRQPSGIHASEGSIEEEEEEEGPPDPSTSPSPNEGDGVAETTPATDESTAASPRSSTATPWTVHLREREGRGPPSPLNLHSHATAMQHQQQQQPQHHHQPQQHQQPQHQQPQQPQQNQQHSPPANPSKITYATPPPSHPGRRSITLRLLEETAPPPQLVKSPLISSVKGLAGIDTPFKSLRKFRSLSLTSSAFSTSMTALDEKAPSPAKGPNEGAVDRGTITVSWYDGTTSNEMQDHVFNCVLRKLNSIPEVQMRTKGGGKAKLKDVRLLDENVTPHGEVVLCPFLPDGSHFLLRFKLTFDRPPAAAPAIHPRFPNPYAANPPYASRPPDSPSAEPSPHPSTANLEALDSIHHQNSHLQKQHLQTQQMLGMVAALLQQQQRPGQSVELKGLPRMPLMPDMGTSDTAPKEEKKEEDPGTKQSTGAPASTSPTFIKRLASGGILSMEPIAENPTTDQLIEQQLRQLNELFLQRRSSSVVSTANDGVSAKDGKEHPEDDDAKPAAYYREEKKQVIFVIANYLVLFLAFVALSAEIQNRLPTWMQWVQENYDSVQNCATDRDALTECLSNGDFSGLVASFFLWASQSASAKRIFLFGFDTPKKLWTVVYEALVTAVCWGTSYLFIRRGLNPNTRQNFLHKYWKDAVYGSLAGFNAAFMKAVLKNLVPQDVALEALEGRQLKIFHWLGSLMAEE